MAVPAWLGAIFSKGTGDIITTLGDTAKKFITTEADRQAFELALKGVALDARRLEMEAEQKYFEDKASARDMYKTDNKLQKIYALTFLIGYLIMSATLVVIITGWIGFSNINIPEWGVALISSIFTAMSTKVATVTDFYFGSSQGSREKDESFATDVQKLMSSKQDK